MSDIEGLVRAGVEKRLAMLRTMEERFEELQRDRLRIILARHADTEFGLAHGFAGMGSVEDYRRRVPTSTARDYHDAWVRIAGGARNVLFADPVHAYGLSSGTTGEPKRVPLTQALVRGLRRAVSYATACYMAQTEDYSLLRGYALQLASPARMETAPDGTSVGFITGIISAARTYPFHNIAIPPPEVLEIADWGRKYDLVEQRYADHDVRMLFGITGHILGALRHIAARRGLGSLRALWPHLSLIVSSGTALDGYRRLFADLCPGAEMREMYLATEAPVAFQPDPGPTGLMPLVEDIFFEFVPEDRWGEENAPRLSLSEVEPGVRYVLLVTTPSGLYAYSPGDVVRFLGMRPPRMVAEGRLGNVLDLTTEKLEAPQAEAALRRAGVDFEDFTVCPAADGTLAHEWVVEFHGEPPADVAARIDAELRTLNPTYHVVREGAGPLSAPVVTGVRPGTFARALQRRPGQGKILRIYKDRSVRDELVDLSGA